MSQIFWIWLGSLIAGYLAGYAFIGFLARRSGAAGTGRFYMAQSALFLLFFILLMVLVIESASWTEFLAGKAKQPAAGAEEFFSRLPVLQLILMGLAGTVWIIGGNIVVYRHLRSEGQPWWAMFIPFRPVSRHLDAKSWRTLGWLFLVGLGLLVAASSLPLDSPGARNAGVPAESQGEYPSPANH